MHMSRLSIWVIAGLCFGGIIHIIAVLGVPFVTDKTPWNGIAELGGNGKFHLVTRDDTPIGSLDPAMLHAACAFDLDGESSGFELDIEAGLWTVSVFDSFGRSVFALSGKEPSFGLSLVTAVEPEAEVESTEEKTEEDPQQNKGFAAKIPDDKGFIVLRIYSPYESERSKVTRDLKKARCT